MLETLRDLIAHKGHANAAMLAAIRQNGAAASDSELCELLNHILLANRFWLLTFRGLPFNYEAESRSPSTFEAVAQRFCTTHEQEAAWLATVKDADLARVLEVPLLPSGKCSVLQALIQVCMHSHGHRAQCAKLLRRHGGVPPPTDFIIWLTNRPAAEWPVPAVPPAAGA